VSDKPTKFENYIFKLGGKDRCDDEDDLDELGADGWELVAVVVWEGRLQAFLKRRVQGRE
jgi:hypothetical protein